MYYYNYMKVLGKTLIKPHSQKGWRRGLMANHSSSLPTGHPTAGPCFFTTSTGPEEMLACPMPPQAEMKVSKVGLPCYGDVK